MKRPSIKQFQKLILDWHKDNGRHYLPWRHTHDPYRIMVSEVMLQQTQVDRVIEKYNEFLKKFPTVQALSRASVLDLLKAWKGLGYNRRALNLQKAAQKVLHDFHGHFPEDIADIQKFPGIGPYTARAIATFAFKQPHVFIETNIRRIFIHFFFPGRKTVSDDELISLVEKSLFRKDTYRWYSALMDYGALAMKDVPNPNKKSKHYTRQSRFEGSQRYARAKILDYIVAHKKATLGQLSLFCESDPYLTLYRLHLRDILDLLCKEGFIAKKRCYWNITS